MSTVIYIQENYGYRHWQWRTALTLDQVVRFFLALPQVDTQLSPTGFPGTVEEISNPRACEDRVATLHLHEETDSFLECKDGRLYFRPEGEAKAPEWYKGYVKPEVP